MTDLKERDTMSCRACGRDERASEGYPCLRCGTFICNICSLRGVSLCRQCQQESAANGTSGAAPAP